MRTVGLLGAYGQYAGERFERARRAARQGLPGLGRPRFCNSSEVEEKPRMSEERIVYGCVRRMIYANKGCVNLYHVHDHATRPRVTEENP